MSVPQRARDHYRKFVSVVNPMISFFQSFLTFAVSLLIAVALSRSVWLTAADGNNNQGDQTRKGAFTKNKHFF